MNSISNSKAGGYGVVFLLLILWEVSSQRGWVDSNYLPPLSLIGRDFYELVKTLEIVRHTLVSLKRVLLGFCLGACAGYLLGFLCGYIARVYWALELIVEYLRPMPSVALIPIAILFLGMGDVLNIAIIGWACSWPVFINTMDGVRSTDHVLVNTARTFGLGRAAVVRKVIVPASLPYVFTGLRVSLGIAVAVVVITEMVVSGSGLGSFILTTSLSFRVAQMYAGIVTVGLFGYILNRVFLLVERKALRWQRGFPGIGK